MPKFPVDAPLPRVLRALERLGFRVVRQANHVSLLKVASDGTRTPMTLPGHAALKGSTLGAALTQAGIDRDEFLRAYEEA